MVYLVDDDVDDLEIMQEALALNSYKGPVRTAMNGLELMKDLNNPAAENRPDVILLDLNMPLKDGFTVMQEIKRDPSLSAIPIIVLSATSNKNDEIRSFELGCSFFFHKPHRMPDYDPIVMMVKRFIAKR